MKKKVKKSIKPLTCEKEVIISVGYGDLEDFVREYYGVPDYEFVADQECGNDSQHRFLVTKAKLEKYDLEKIEKFKAGDHPNYITATLLVDLCNKNIIDSGKYVVSVCW